jgi:poly(3-hydroxybutyrate) depolymerase
MHGMILLIKKMKVFLLMAVLLNISVAFSQEHAALQWIDHFGNNPGNLKMFIYADISRKDTSLKPLVIVLHGCGQSVDEIAGLTGWNKLASLNGFFVLYPHQKLLNKLATVSIGLEIQISIKAGANVNRSSG